MLQDIFGSLIAVLAFAAVLYAPGYLFAYTTNLFGFRRMPFAERSPWAIAASFCISPIAAYLIGRSAGLSGIAWLLCGCTLATLLLLMQKRNRQGWSRNDAVITSLIVCGWTVFVLLMLVDFQTGHKLYFTVVMADESYRIAFIDAVARTGVPPANPLYFAGSPAPMRYYYFWYVLCAAIAKGAHVTPRQSYIASCIWAGFGLLVTVKLYATRFFRWGRKQQWIALGLLLVSGAGLIPALGQAILQPSLNGDIEWWSVDPIDAWPDSLLWVPHHVASVLCCLLVFLLLWRTLEPLNRADKRWTVVLAALASASAVGLSVYVATGFALLMLAWLVWLMLKSDPHRKSLWLRSVTVAAASAIFLAPFLRELSGALHTSAGTAANGTSNHLFVLSVRRMIDSNMFTGLPIFSTLNQSHPVLLDQTLRLLLLLPGLAMELGLYGAILIFLLRAKRRKESMPGNDARNTALFFTLCGLVITMFLSSSVISNNDFGYRAVMLPQFFLLLLAADVLGSWWVAESSPVIIPTPAKRRWVYGLLAVGIAGFFYGAFLLRAWLPVEVAHPQNGFAELPEDSYQVREAFAVLDRAAPQNSVLTFNPIDRTIRNAADQSEVMTPGEYFQRMLVMDAGRQMLNAERQCATHFGGNPSLCTAIQDATRELYGNPAPNTQWAREYCSRFGVQYLVFTHRDPTWSTPQGWQANLPIVVREPGLEILRCSQ